MRWAARRSALPDETYDFDMPFAKAQPMEAYKPGKCPESGAPIQMHLKRTRQRQLAPPLLEGWGLTKALQTVHDHHGLDDKPSGHNEAEYQHYHNRESEQNSAIGGDARFHNSLLTVNCGTIRSPILNATTARKSAQETL